MTGNIKAAISTPKLESRKRATSMSVQILIHIILLGNTLARVLKLKEILVE